MKPITRKEIYLNQIAENTGGNGGDTGLTPITREEHYFDAIVKNTASGGGGSDLPAVTAVDNGDVLTVVNGEWDKATPSGGSASIVYCPATATSGKGRPTGLGMTWQEIHDAVAAGKFVFITLSIDEGSTGYYTNIYPISQIGYAGNINKYYVAYPVLNEEYAYVYWLYSDTTDGYPEDIG